MKNMVDITELFYPKDRGEWRSWLSKYHHKKTEIWLVFYKKHTGKLTVAYQDAVDEALCFGWIDGIEKRLDDERYVNRFTPRRKTSNWSDINIGRYKMLVEKRLMTEAGKNVFENRKKK